MRTLTAQFPLQQKIIELVLRLMSFLFKKEKIFIDDSIRSFIAELVLVFRLKFFV